MVIKQFIFIPIILLFACAQVKFIPTGNIYEPWDGPVKILEKPPSNIHYEEIGVITGKMSGMVSDWGAILKAMQKKARSKGANAIILINKETSKQSSFGGSVQYGFYGGSYQEKNMMARLIRIFDDSESLNLYQQPQNDYYKNYNIIKVVKGYCLIKVDSHNKFQMDAVYDIFRKDGLNYIEVGSARVVRFKNDNIAFQIIDGSIKVGDKIRYNK